MNRTNDEHIGHIKALLDKPIPLTTIELQDTLRALCEAHTLTVIDAATAQARLHKKRLQYLHPKDKEMTDFDRKIHLDANTADEQLAYDMLHNLAGTIEIRIAVITTLLTT